MSSRTLSPLVGIHFRPPAKAVLAHLPSGTALRLAREPFNEYDPQAIAVFVATSAIPASQHASLEAALAGFGFLLPEVLARSEHQLGYIAAKPPKGMGDGFALASALAPRLDTVPAPGYAARLALDGAGRPFVEIDWASP